MKENVIARICNLPLDFSKGNKSALSLLQESGIMRIADEVVVKDIKNYLQGKEYLLKEWQIWSEDKRTSGGYFLSLDDSNSFIGMSNSIGQNTFKKQFTSKIDATAEYILKEVFTILGKTINE